MISTTIHSLAGNLKNASGRCLLIFAATLPLSACDRQPTLPPELASIQCESGKEEHGQKTFGNADVYFLCMNNELSNRLGSLSCDSTNHSMHCDEIQNYMLSRSAEGKIYSGQLPKEILQLDPSRSDMSRDSSLIVTFRHLPSSQSNFSYTGTNREFLLTDSSNFLPNGFTLTEGIRCDKVATPLNEGRCILTAKSASLYWNIHVSIRQNRGVPMSPGGYRDELNYWSKYIGKMVVDPKA